MTKGVRVAQWKPVNKKSKTSTRKKPGPEPDRLKIEGNWKEAMKQSLQKKRPAKGWPKN
jgi:hypothetical protein